MKTVQVEIKSRLLRRVKPAEARIDNARLRLVQTIDNGNRKAKVYKDSDVDEYVVKFYEDNQYKGDKADYFTSDRGDANGTAKQWVNKAKGASAVATVTDHHQRMVERRLTWAVDMRQRTCVMSKEADPTKGQEMEIKQLREFVRILDTQGSTDGPLATTAKHYAEMLKIQMSKGNWDSDAYMHGMLNGMVLMAYTWAHDNGLVKPGDDSQSGGEAPFMSAPEDGFHEDKPKDDKPPKEAEPEPKDDKPKDEPKKDDKEPPKEEKSAGPATEKGAVSAIARQAEQLSKAATGYAAQIDDADLRFDFTQAMGNTKSAIQGYDRFRAKKPVAAKS